MNTNNASNSNEFDPKKNDNNQTTDTILGFDLEKILDETRRDFESGKLDYDLAKEKLFGADKDYEGGMEDMIDAAKKGSPDALNWLVNAGIRLIIPDILWEKKISKLVKAMFCSFAGRTRLALTRQWQIFFLV